MTDLIWNPEARAEDQMTIIADETKIVEDAGKRYQVRLVTVNNSARNIANGARAKTCEMVVVHKLKKDGSTGLRLTSWNKRLWEVFRGEA